MNKIGLIIWREFITRVRKASFLIMTILGPVLSLSMCGQSMDRLILVDDGSEWIINRINDDQHVHFVNATGRNMDDFRKSDSQLLLLIPEDILNVNMAALIYKEHPSRCVIEHLQGELDRIVSDEKKKSFSGEAHDDRDWRTKIHLKLINIAYAD